MLRYCVLAAALLVGGAQAAEPAPSAKKDLVKKVLLLQQAGIESVGTQLAGQTAQQVLQSAGQALARVPADKREQVGNDIQADVRKFFDEVSPALRANAVKQAPGILGVALEERLSEDELKTLVAWLESPVSKKYQQLSLESHQPLAQKVVSESRTGIEPKLKALEQSIGKRLGMPASAPAPSPAPAKK